MLHIGDLFSAYVAQSKYMESQSNCSTSRHYCLDIPPALFAWCNIDTLSSKSRHCHCFDVETLTAVIQSGSQAVKELI